MVLEMIFKGFSRMLCIFFYLFFKKLKLNSDFFKHFFRFFSSMIFFSQTTRVIPQLIIIMAQALQGVILQYNVALSRAIPSFAAWQIAFCSAWTVLTQCWELCPSSCWRVFRRCPTSSQWGSHFGAQTYPVTKIWFALAITHPLLQRSQVALFAIALQTSIKYSSRERRTLSQFSIRFFKWENKNLTFFYIL